MAPCVRFSLLGKAVPRLIGFCPVCVSWQKRSVTAPFGHRLSDELSEIILDYLHFDHRLTTTVQWHYKMLEKPVVTTNNGLFLVLAANVQNQHNLRFIDGLYRPVVVLRRQVPGVRIPSGALKKRLLHKEKIQVQQPPVFMKEKRREYPVTDSVQTVPQ
jgi:hypothetical protein